MHRRTGSCHKHCITAENSTARDTSYIKEGFRLRIRFAEKGLGLFDKEKKGTWANGGGERKLFQKLNT